MKETTQNNILLAEFLGVKEKESNWFDGYELQEAGLPFNYGAMGNGTRDLKFHTSWDWLMLVVDKIDKTELSGLTFAVDILNGLTQIICYGECKINGVVLPSDTTLLMAESKSRIESTYSACVQFVKWYNENKYQNETIPTN